MTVWYLFYLRCFQLSFQSQSPDGVGRSCYRHRLPFRTSSSLHCHRSSSNHWIPGICFLTNIFTDWTRTLRRPRPTTNRRAWNAYCRITRAAIGGNLVTWRIAQFAVDNFLLSLRPNSTAWIRADLLRTASPRQIEPCLEHVRDMARLSTHSISFSICRVVVSQASRGSGIQTSTKQSRRDKTCLYGV